MWSWIKKMHSSSVWANWIRWKKGGTKCLQKCLKRKLRLRIVVCVRVSRTGFQCLSVLQEERENARKNNKTSLRESTSGSGSWFRERGHTIFWGCDIPKLLLLLLLLYVHQILDSYFCLLLSALPSFISLSKFRLPCYIDCFFGARGICINNKKSEQQQQRRRKERTKTTKKKTSSID